MLGLNGSSIALRIGVVLGVGACGLAGCAVEPLAPRQQAMGLMRLQAPAEPIAASSDATPGEVFESHPGDRHLAHKSMAAKVLASRALANVTGLPIDPARLSEHD